MDKATWQQRAERELGRPVARLDYSPVPEVRVPALVTSGPPSSRGTGTSAGWQVASTHAGSPEVVAESVADDVQGGVEAIRVDVRAFRGARDLAMAVNAAEPEHRPFALAHGAIGDAATLVGLIRGLRRDVSSMQLDFGLDPIGELARNGFLQGPFDKHVASGADLVRWCRDEAPRCRVFVADGTVWHDRGADEALSIALTVGTALAYLRGMEAEGLSIEDAFGAIELRQSVPGRFLLGVAKLRATRRIVARVVEIAQTRGRWEQTATPAWRERTERAPAVNILRNTAATFAAIAGGATRIDVPAHVPTPEGRRLARNTQLVLRDESHLGAVMDPAGGAHALEALTDQLATRAWSLLQVLEREGGVLAALQSGFVRASLKGCSDRRDLLVRTRKRPILGVSRYADLSEDPPMRVVDDELPTSVPGGLDACSTFEELLPHALRSHSSELTHARVGPGLTRAPLTEPKRLAVPFERLRSRAERDPRSIYLATLGPLAEHGARTAFGRELVEAGGLHVVTDDEASTPEAVVEAWKRTETRVVVLSMADARFATDGVQAARELTRAGAKVWGLGRPGEPAAALEAAGVRGWFATGSDALESLLSLWEHA